MGMITVRFGGGGRLTLNNPPHNLIGSDFIEEFCSAQERAVEDGMRAILIRSDLRHFCAGADVSALDREGVEASITLDRLESIPIPTVAAVHGAVLGGGFHPHLRLYYRRTVSANWLRRGSYRASSTAWRSTTIN